MVMRAKMMNPRIFFLDLWLLMFLIIKIGGTSFDSWSWLWILFPIVPDLVFIIQKLGWSL